MQRPPTSPPHRMQDGSATLSASDRPVVAGHGTSGVTLRPPAVASYPRPSRERSWPRALRAFLGWTGVAACALYGGFGFYAAVVELLSLAGVADAPPSRAAPPLFVLHAVTGGVALVAGALQLKLAHRLLRKRPRAHRVIGRTYLVATWVTCAGGLGTTAFFDVGWAGRTVFAVWSISWSAATAIALRRVRAGRFGEHRKWMIRSFALALVFLTFDISRSVFVGVGLPRTVVYPLGLLLSATVGLGVAELWIRRTKTRPRGQGGS